MSYSTLIKPLAFASLTLVLVAVPFVLPGQISTETFDTAAMVIVHSADDATAQLGVVQGADADTPETGDAEEPDNVSRTSNGIDDLTSELLETLREMVGYTERQYSAGTTQLDVVFRAREKLFGVQLDLAQSQPERLRILEQRLDNRREFEAFVDQAVSAGIRTPEKLLEAKADRLEAQMALLKEQASGSSPASRQTDWPPKMQGLVLNSNAERVEISLGSGDGLRRGHTLIVFRDSAYLGRITVERLLAEDRSVARVESRRGVIRRGDSVAIESRLEPDPVAR